MNEEKRLTIMKRIGIILLVIIGLNFIQGIVDVVQNKQWVVLYEKSITIAILAIVAYIYRDLFKKGWKDLKRRREASREKFEQKKGNIDLKEAAIFSLAWSREIYRGIPADRKPLVKTSFIFIGIAVGLVMLHLGSDSLLTIITVAALILAGVNLLIWVVGSEREEKDRIRIELETARRMQLSLMPDAPPSIKGFDIAGCCIPANDVGGDLFDYVWSGGEQKKLCITVVDVSGKGMDAALTAVYTSGALVSEAQHEDDVVTVAQNLNSAIYSRQNRSRFVSMLMTTLDVSSGKMQYVNAGQSRPMLLQDQQLSVLKGTGPRFPLGVMKSPAYQAAEVRLKPGDSLLLYTDGVTEAMNAKEEMFGEERLKALFRQLVNKHSQAVDMVEAVKYEINKFAGSAQQHDDLTVVIVNAV